MLAKYPAAAVSYESNGERISGLSCILLHLQITIGKTHCEGPESTHLICNREGGHQLIKNVTRQKTRIGGYGLPLRKVPELQTGAGQSYPSFVFPECNP